MSNITYAFVMHIITYIRIINTVHDLSTGRRRSRT